MKKIAWITDSTCGLSEQEIEELGNLCYTLKCNN